jgi:hypothetical protein
MAAYPTLPWSDGTKTDADGGFEVDRATNGALKIRKLWPDDKRSFQLVHWLTPAEKTTLASFYGTNKLLNVTLTAADDAADYTVRFTAAPVYEWRAGALAWAARVSLVEV